ncbi:MAG: hypothetical protein IJ306_08870 [Oscillospiraceae bacterium]|nr:hypothetical protein [Oscillospiraceae bacterium]
MAENVVTINAEGESVVHEDVSGVELFTESGGTATFIHDAEILNPDWAQTDSTKKDFIKNKPNLAPVATEGTYASLKGKLFGDIPVPIEEQEFTFAEVDPEEFPGLYGCEFDNGSFPEMFTGESYIVNWDGKEYTCVCKNSEIDGFAIDGHRLGNDTLILNFGLGTDTGEPFVFVRNTDGGGGCNTLDTSASHTVSITPVNETIRIDKKYLPEDLGTGTGAGLPEVTESDNGKVLGVVGGAWAKMDAPAGGSVLTEEVILEETTFDEFVHNENFGAYVYYLSPAPMVPVVGEYYKVVWDGTEYECIGQDASSVVEGATFIGNAAGWGLEGKGEPFIIGGQTTSPMNIMCLTDTESTPHTVAIYQKVPLAVSWNDLTDKPFGGEIATIFEGEFQDTLTDTDGDGVNDAWAGGTDGIIIEDTSDATLEAGKTYKVTWEGTAYECECISTAGLLIIGNNAPLGGEDNGIPFAIMRDASGLLTGTPMWNALLVDDPTDLTISGLYSCKIEGEITVYIDNKYLEILEGEDTEETEVFAEQTVEWNDESSSGLYEFNQILEIGKKYVVVWDGEEYEVTGFAGDGLCVGNMNIVDASYGDTGEPFLVATMVQNGENVGAFFKGTSEVNESHVVSIYALATRKTIKRERLPEPLIVPFEFDLVSMGFTNIVLGGSTYGDRDTKELRKALEEGPVKINAVFNSVSFENICYFAYKPGSSTYSWTGIILSNDNPYAIEISVSTTTVKIQSIALATAATT